MRNANILLSTIEGGGNVTPMLGLAKKLLKGGHTVHMLSEHCLEAPIRNLGASFIPFKKHFTRKDRKEDLFKDWNASKINNPVFKNIMFGPASDTIDQCIEVIQNKSIDILVVDVLIFPAIIAAEALGIPKVVVFHMPEFLPGPNRPPGNMGLKPGKGILKWRDKLLTKLMTAKFDEFKPALNAKLEAYALPPLRHTLDLFDRADLRFIQTTKAFDIPIEPAPPNVRYIGPELGDPDWVNDNIWENPWSDANEKPLVVVSFSSTFQNQAGAIQNSMDALQELPVNGIVTLGPAMENHRFNIPSNVLVLESVKHSDLFPHADVVITHGGHGTVIRALSHGLPILCMPMGRDQDDNAIKVKMKGCGLNLSPKATAVKIRKAVKKILGDKNFLTNAKKMRTLIREKAETSDPVEAIDTLLSIKEEATI